MAGKWTAEIVGAVVGLIVGLVFGQLVVQSIRGGGGAVFGVEARVGLFVLGAVVLALLVIAGILALSPERRRNGLAFALAAVGLVVGYWARLLLG